MGESLSTRFDFGRKWRVKAFASRDQDWLDIKGILIRQGDRLDWPYILEQLPRSAS
jgi:hypothetical protein